jgi:adenosylmethionine-8-amino-7-oxononanoate aminotransferase
MTIPHRPKVTEGSTAGFNPKCNQSTSAGVTFSGTPSAAEVAAKAQAQYAERQAEQEAYRRAKDAQKGQPSADQKRWLSSEEIM